jgi:hypothetical protein
MRLSWEALLGPLGAIGDDPQVDSGQELEQLERQGRLGEPAQGAGWLGCPHQHVCGAAVLGDVLGDERDVVPGFDEEVRAEHGGQSAKCVELLVFLFVGVVAGHPQQVELGAESLGGTPRATDHALRFRLRFHQRERALADRGVGGRVVQAVLALTGVRLDRDALG